MVGTNSKQNQKYMIKFEHMADGDMKRVPSDNVEELKKVYKLTSRILEILLKDRSTGKNILWATGNYSSHGPEYEKEKTIELSLITGRHSRLVKPRTMKSQREQVLRTRDMAETFTPSWICNKQNNLVDEVWFGRKDVFNIETGKSWIPSDGSIEFSDVPGKTWQDYVKAPRLEMTCGEAPYLVSLYDTTSGEQIPIKQRIGLLDRKLRVVGENTLTEEEWVKWAVEAFKATYGYEFQGDNLLLARENLIFTFIDYFQDRFNRLPAQNLIDEIAFIISWNLWQMDGMKYVVPFSCINETESQLSLFGDTEESLLECPGCKTGNVRAHNGTYCKIMNWKEGKAITAVSLLS